MKFLEKMNNLAEGLLALREKFDKIDKDALLKDDLEELNKIEELLDFYIATILEMVVEQNKEFVKDNKEPVKKIVSTIEDFIKRVNENINEDFFK